MHAPPTEINSVIDIYTLYVQAYVSRGKRNIVAFIWNRGGRFMAYVHANHVHAFILSRGGRRDREIEHILRNIL